MKSIFIVLCTKQSHDAVACSLQEFEQDMCAERASCTCQDLQKMKSERKATKDSEDNTTIPLPVGGLSAGRAAAPTNGEENRSRSPCISL